jgi:aldehyde:ferredoxin oxidoreductase
MEKFLDRYYELRGWSKKGVPTPQKLDKLGLGPIVKEMTK